MTREQERALRRLERAQLREAARVVRVVAALYPVPLDALRGRCRTGPVAEARQIAMYLMRTRLHWPTERGNTHFTATRVARVLGRDHATVLHGVGAISTRLGREEPLRQLVADLRAALDDTYEDEERLAARRAA